jgi:hypothetical protein
MKQILLYRGCRTLSRFKNPWQRDHPGFPAPSFPSELGCRVELSLGCSYYS